MNIKRMLMKLVFPNSYSREAYINYLRKNKVIIGNNVTIYQPNHVTIDIRKPYMISIGNNCKITRDVTILAHDYGVSVPRRVYGKYVGGKNL